MTAEEQRLVNEATVAVRRVRNGCEAGLSRTAMMAVVGFGEVLELWEDKTVPAARTLAVVDGQPLRAVR
ncbi:MAG: hypothetical protein JJE35_08490 [Thermoleophilia bacterium]|nr:hypothetical protein [Thermoleophilia bacterium]